MDTLLIVCGVALAVAVLYAMTQINPKRGDDGGPWPFYSRTVLSPPEQVLYFRLCSALPQQVILAQVGLSRVLGVKKGNDFHTWNNRINRMSADFVVCNKDGSVLAVIELDDSTHKQERRREADAKKDKALASADVKIIRWNVKAMPNEADIRAAFSIS